MEPARMLHVEVASIRFYAWVQIGMQIVDTLFVRKFITGELASLLHVVGFSTHSSIQRDKFAVRISHIIALG